MPHQVMPPEWEPHERTWMAWPTANATLGTAAELARARRAWGAVVRAVAAHEPVALLVDPADVGSLPGTGGAEPFGPAVTAHEVPLDDAWLRDSGPTFARDATGAPVVLDWVFNGWGAQSWARWDHDAHVARAVADLAGVPSLGVALVNEGGGFHVDGRGTVLLTDTVQRDPGRNPGLTREDVEALVHPALGTTHAVWLPRGLTADYGTFGTRGHVDIVAAFCPSGAVLAHHQDDPGHPDHAVTAEVRAVLGAARGADGRRLEVVDLPAPSRHEVDGELVDWSYVNHYVANDVVVLCAFDDPRDDGAAAVLRDVYPGREVVQVDARDVFAFGGGIHCITQQQPAAGPAGG